jgi:hypothetical protein
VVVLACGGAVLFEIKDVNGDTAMLVMMLMMMKR